MVNLSLVRNCATVRCNFEFSDSLNIYTDTRKYKHPGAFVCIPGSKVNPLDIINELLNQGCPIVFYQIENGNEEKVSLLKLKYPLTKFIPVSNSVRFLQEIAFHHIQDWKIKNPKNILFAISGSNGKTTHKEMLSFILKEVIPGKTISTEKNNNNHLGVPLTLLNVCAETQMVVLELGSNHPGEIELLCDISQPNAGLTTNIGATHLEFFGSENEVFLEEGFLYYAVKKTTDGKGFYLINVDDPFLKNLPPTEGSIRYGENDLADAKVKFLDNGAEIYYGDQKFVAVNHFITGKHNKLNLVTCLFIAAHFFPEHKNKFIQACEKFMPTKNRSEWINFEGRRVYLDAYNANPSSMKVALTGFKESVLAAGHKLSEACIVLGDMYELGDSSPIYHKSVASYVKDLGFTNVYFVGQYSPHYLKGFPEAHAMSSITDFKSFYRQNCLHQFLIHFVKGSRSLQLEHLFDIT